MSSDLGKDTGEQECAWHGVRAALLVWKHQKTNKNSPPFWTEGQHQQGKGIVRDDGSGGSMR
jgi:hypothetical protein